MALLDLLGVLQEEAAEVIKEVSKVRRSGPGFVPFADAGFRRTNMENLEAEVCDFLALLLLWREYHGGPNFDEMVDRMYVAKFDKLMKWSPEVFRPD